MPTTDDELAKKRDKLEKLREQVAEAEDTRLQRERELSNDISAAELDAEEARLTHRLSIAKEMSKVSVVKAGAAQIFENIENPGAVIAPGEPAPAEKE